MSKIRKSYLLKLSETPLPNKDAAGWEQIEWDGNPALNNVTIFDVWRKKFRHGHVTIFYSTTFGFMYVIFSFGANSDDSFSSSLPGKDTATAKRIVDEYMPYHFQSGAYKKYLEIQEKHGL